jgi:hypothetical protein
MTMASSDDVITATMRKRPWWFWALAAIWLQLEVMVVQTALASVRESEFRAAVISWVAAALFAIAGVFGWLRQGDSRKLNKPSEPI